MDAAFSDGYDAGYNDGVNDHGINNLVDRDYFDETLVTAEAYDESWQEGYRKGYEEGVVERVENR
jgi:hypothetical protein